MAFLNGHGLKSRIDNGDISIRSLFDDYPFEARNQITEDCVDLRLHPEILVFKDGLEEVDFLNDDLAECFERLTIPLSNGYLLEPGGIVFGQTLEFITFPDDLIGFAYTRASFAQLGLMVTCSSPKFGVGHNWALSLQVSNCGPLPLRIYPFSAMIQLLVAEIQPGLSYPKNGKLWGRFVPEPPSFNEREKENLRGRNTDMDSRVEHLE